MSMFDAIVGNDDISLALVFSSWYQPSLVYTFFVAFWFFLEANLVQPLLFLLRAA
jgi:hypothetical protein